MKKLAIFIHSLPNEYSLDVLNGIAKFFEDKDVLTFIAQTREPHDPYGIFEYQCWSSAEYLFSKQIDAYLVLTGSYTSHITVETLSNHLTNVGDRPVISIGMPLLLQNSYYTKVQCDSVYDEIVRHLKLNHRKKRIAFMSANQTKSQEAIDRFEAYKAAMKNNGFEYDESLVMDGKFRRGRSKNCILDKYKSKADIDFDAILCANDMSALGVQEALQELGVSIPGEIAVVGFDESSYATSAQPKLSTVDQNVFTQGYVGASLVYDILNGKKVSKCEYVPPSVIYRQSCGCVSLKNSSDVYCNSKGELLHCSKFQQELKDRNRNYFNFLSGIDNIYSLFDLSKAAQTLKKCFNMMKYMMSTAQMESLGVFFLNSPITVQQNQEYNISGKVRVSMYLDENSKTEIFEPGYVYEFKEKIIPDELFSNVKGNLLFMPIFSGEKLYGYIICKPKAKDFAVYSVYMKILINALAQAYEYTETVTEYQKLEEENQKLQQNNSSLNTQSKTDELTKVLNRRGFMDFGQKALDVAKGMDSQGLVIFFDMDGLKIINDTYGHEMGDSAIKSMAKVIKTALRSNDIVGRLGGDEFAAVAIGIRQNQVRNLRRRIRKLCDEEMRANKYPFELSCSAGFTEFNEENCVLEDLLTKSDDLLYKEKKMKHEQRKSRK